MFGNYLDWILFTPFILQGIAMFFDEFYFHHKRRLGQWERIGHPIDTLSILLCYLFVKLSLFSTFHFCIFLALAFFSSLLITKDEFVHKRECDAAECWLHGVLFVLHPMVLGSVCWIWYSPTPFLSQVLSIQLGLILCFMIYQITYWSFSGGSYGKSSRNK
jgi:hypothetical protein